MDDDNSATEIALLLIDNKTFFRLITILDKYKIEGIGLSYMDKTVEDILNSDNYNIVYCLIDEDYQKFSEVVEEIKKKSITPIIAYDINKVDKDRLNMLLSSYEYGFNKAGNMCEQIEDIITKIRDKQARSGSTTSERYVQIKHLGNGGNATVDLYKDMETNTYVAVKQISILNNLNSIEKLKEEYRSMTKIKCPTVIQAYELKIINDMVYIYLEYADGGSLLDKISKYKIKGQKFTFEEIRDYTIDILLALFIMNKHNMIHRDVKSENILLNSDGLAKLCDLGISRTSFENKNYTVCGTPYYVSPEIVSNIPYGFQTDIWSLGIVVYEMITGNKPFSGNTLYDEIKGNPYPDLPVNTDYRLTFLVDVMLMKDPTKRYNVSQLLSIDFMYDSLMGKLYGLKWLEQVEEFKELVSLKKTPIYKQLIPQIFPQEDINLLKEAFIIFFNVPFSSYKKSLLSTSVGYCKKGDDLELAFNDNEDLLSKYKTADNFYNTLLETGVIISLKGNKGFSQNDFFVFSFDNLIYNSSTKIDNPVLLVSQSLDLKFNSLSLNDKVLSIPEHIDLLSLTKAILTDGITLVNRIDKTDYHSKEEIVANTAYTYFNLGISLFKSFKIDVLGRQEKVACLLNIYQIMIINTIVDNFLGNTYTTHDNSNKTYQFEDYLLSDLEIKHVIFRSNKTPPKSYFRKVYNSDPKTKILTDYNDLRVLLILYENERSIIENYRFKFMIFDDNLLERNLEEVCLNFLINYVMVENSVIELACFIEPYIPDFGSEVGIIKMLGEAYCLNKARSEICRVSMPDDFDYLNNIEDLLLKIENGEVKITFESIK
jgi:NIMA (never in mitosis gene a)-related kinase